MSKKSVTVSNILEKHDNPIAELVQMACKFESEITLESDNRRINAKSIMGIMAFTPTEGMTLDIIAERKLPLEAVYTMAIALTTYRVIETKVFFLFKTLSSKSVIEATKGIPTKFGSSFAPKRRISVRA